MSIQAVSLVEHVRRHPGISSVDLAGHFGVSSRTIRDRIRNANDSLSGVARISFHRDCNGYCCDIADEDSFERWVARSRSLSASDPVASMTGRIVYLLNDLLLRDGWVTLDELAERLFVSRASISGDIKRIEPLLEKYDLAIERRPHYGIKVMGTEMSRRLCLAEGAARLLTADECEADAFERELAPLLGIVAATVGRVLTDQSFSINSFAYQNLLIHLGIALIRIRSGNCVPVNGVLSSSVAGTRELEVAHVIAKALGAATGIDLPKSEVAYLAIHLAGKRVFSIDGQLQCSKGSSDEEPEGNVVISDEIWDVVSRMLDVVWQGFRFDFRNDFDLRWGLACHILPLSTRLLYGLKLENPLLQDIKKRYPLAYAMALDASSVLSETYGAQPSDDEMGYLALAFALAMERKKTGRPRRNMLVVCASGAGSARLLMYRMREEFGEQLGSIVTCNVSDLVHYDFSDIDYVVTTVPLPIHLDVPVRQVTLFLDEADRYRVRSLLEGEGDSWELLFSRTLFFTHKRFEDKHEAIAFLCEQASTHEELPSGIEELVWEREHAAPTAFGNGVALPHPIRAVAKRTFVTVALMDAPLDWGGQDVQALFLICVACGGLDGLDRFYDSLADVLNDASAIQELVCHQDFDRFIAELSREGV